MSKLSVSQINKELQKIKSRYEQKYGAAIFDVKIKVPKNDFLILEGKVLAEKQKREISSVAARLAVNIKNNIGILSDPKEKLEIGWGMVKSGIADIWAIFPAKGKLEEKMPASPPASTRSNRDESLGGRATQGVKDDILRILAEKKDWYLAQTKDLTIGWTRKSQISGIKHPISIKKWRKIKRAEPNKIFKISLTKKTKDKFVSFLDKYSNAPYAWGGITEKGIDCSGLTQKFYEEIFGVVLPRHSRDQALCGKEARLSKAKIGDLIFLRHKIKKYPHIGIIIEKSREPEDCLILNARRENGGVVIQNSSDIFKIYKLASVRRLF